MNTELSYEYYDNLLIQNNVQINKKRAINLINIGDTNLFGIKINQTQEIQGSVATMMHQFLHQQCKAILVEQTRDTEEKGKYLLVVYDKGVTATKTKLGTVFDNYKNQLCLKQLAPV